MKTLIGIDPDVDKSGVAIISGDTLELYNLSFFELFEFLENNKELHGKLEVYIEAGWLNKSNWHTKKGASAALNAKIGARTGANHETGKKIVEMCEYLQIRYVLIKPTKKKVNSEYFYKLTGIKRSSQDKRDAAMLIIGRK